MESKPVSARACRGGGRCCCGARPRWSCCVQPRAASHPAELKHQDRSRSAAMSSVGADLLARARAVEDRLGLRVRAIGSAQRVLEAVVGQRGSRRRGRRRGACFSADRGCRRRSLMPFASTEPRRRRGLSSQALKFAGAASTAMALSGRKVGQTRAPETSRCDFSRSRACGRAGRRDRRWCRPRRPWSCSMMPRVVYPGLGEAARWRASRWNRRDCSASSRPVDAERSASARGATSGRGDCAGTVRHGLGPGLELLARRGARR